nr:hypothetical protein [Tanacetum cinerariifolium]
MGKLHKPSRGIKISMPGSAGARLILRRVRSAKVSGRACERVDRSPVDFRGGKRVSVAPANDEISQKSRIPKDGAWNSDGINAFGSSIPSNQFSAGVDRFAEKLKQAEEVYKGGQSCALQLYEYFIGTSMDYRVARGNLMRMWRVYDIEKITKTNSGIYYFKFKSEEGMKKVLESGPCGIGKIMSGVGKPLLMDNMTRERCLKKARKIDFARVLVKVSAEDELPNILEIEYPPLGGGLVQRNQFHQKSNFDAGSMKAGRKYNNNNKPSFQEVNKKPIVDKPVLASTFNHKFRPKVLVRGSGSAMVMDNSLKEDIHVKNDENSKTGSSKGCSLGQQLKKGGGEGLRQQLAIGGVCLSYDSSYTEVFVLSCRGSSPLGGCLFEAAEAAGACFSFRGVFVSEAAKPTALGGCLFSEAAKPTALGGVCFGLPSLLGGVCFGAAETSSPLGRCLFEAAEAA